MISGTEIAVPRSGQLLKITVMLLQMEVLFSTEPRLVLLDALHAEQIGLDEFSDLRQRFVLISTRKVHVAVVVRRAVLLEFDSAAGSRT